MITASVLRSALALSIISSSSSFVHQSLQIMSNTAASSLRRSSRLKTSPYFSGAASPQRAGTSPYFPAVDTVTEIRDSIHDDDGASKMRTKRTAAADKSPDPKKQKRSPSNNKPVSIERTTSFEPAWWGNVLVDRTQSTLVTKPAKNEPTKTANYPPVHTLILGTHPSIASLSTNQFFGHQQNAFWYLVGDALGFRRNEAVSATTKKPYATYYNHLRYDTNTIIEYDDQLELFVSRGFALWDIVRECERKGSLDQDINSETPNLIREFCQDRGSVRRIVIANGTTGGKFFVKHFKEWFVDGGVVAGRDDMSQRCFKAVMNSAKKAAVVKTDRDDKRGAIEVVCLPSVSPAAAKFTYLEKREAWERWCFEPGLADYKDWAKRSYVHGDDDKSPKKETKGMNAVSPSPAKTPANKSVPKSPSTASTASSQKSSPNKALAIQFASSDIAKLSPENDWIDLQVPPEELRPSATLTNGQCFNWMVVDTENGDGDQSNAKQSAWGSHDATEWIGPLGDRVLSIRETPSSTLYRVLHGPLEGTTDDLRKYFRLETPLAPLYKEWSEADTRLSKIAAVIPGCRILRQDPIECMFSFICSSNNNIPRITKMLTAFRKDYGQFMMEVPTQTGEDYAIFSFPTLEALSSATEDDLRSMGLGYRAKYITETRDLLKECGGGEYLLKLRKETNAQIVQDELIKFSGIGRKVADCIALFSLDSDEAIPVDVHVQHIASRDYDPTVLGSAKSITPTIYKRVGDLFRSRFPSFAGWAHSLLFVAELPSFRGVLPSDIVQQMDQWRDEEQRKKLEQKQQKKAPSD